MGCFAGNCTRIAHEFAHEKYGKSPGLLRPRLNVGLKAAAIIVGIKVIKYALNKGFSVETAAVQKDKEGNRGTGRFSAFQCDVSPSA